MNLLDNIEDNLFLSIIWNLAVNRNLKKNDIDKKHRKKSSFG